jgi:hypothetical protein
MLEHRIDLTQILSVQCEFKCMQMHVSEASYVKLVNPTYLQSPGMQQLYRLSILKRVFRPHSPY